MKTKKFLLPAIFLAVTIIAYIVAMVIFCYTTKPEVSKGEFPFSITYEYKGETHTLSGVMECEYSGSETIHGEHNRYWDEETKYDNPLNLEYPFVIEQSEEVNLSIYDNMYAGYFMGDPLQKDHYRKFGLEGPEPYIEYYDHKNGISSNDENRAEIMEAIGFKFIDFTYAEPIENSFSFSGVEGQADNVIIFIAVLLVFFLLCLFFVRKDKEYKYSILDKIGIILNFLIAIFAVPFISFICIMFGAVGSSIEFVEQIVYSIPQITILCLALSVVFRRKGYSKTGFFIQFGGVLLFAIILLLDVAY